MGMELAQELEEQLGEALAHVMDGQLVQATAMCLERESGLVKEQLWVQEMGFPKELQSELAKAGLFVRDRRSRGREW